MKLFESRKEKFFKTVLLLFPLFLLQKQHLQEKLSSYMPSAILQFVLHFSSSYHLSAFYYIFISILSNQRQKYVSSYVNRDIAQETHRHFVQN